MNITSATITLGTGFNDGYEDYRNHRIGVTLTAEDGGGDGSPIDLIELYRMAAAELQSARQRVIIRRRLEQSLESLLYETDPVYEKLTPEKAEEIAEQIAVVRKNAAEHGIVLECDEADICRANERIRKALGGGGSADQDQGI